LNSILLIIFFLKADSETVEFFLKHPLESIGAIILALVFFQIGSNFIKWIQSTIKDEFNCKILIVFSMITLAILYFVILHQFEISK